MSSRWSIDDGDGGHRGGGCRSGERRAWNLDRDEGGGDGKEVDYRGARNTIDGMAIDGWSNADGGGKLGLQVKGGLGLGSVG